MKKAIVLHMGFIAMMSFLPESVRADDIWNDITVLNDGGEKFVKCSNPQTINGVTICCGGADEAPCPAQQTTGATGGGGFVVSGPMDTNGSQQLARLNRMGPKSSKDDFKSGTLVGTKTAAAVSAKQGHEGGLFTDAGKESSGGMGGGTGGGSGGGSGSGYGGESSNIHANGIEDSTKPDSGAATAGSLYGSYGSGNGGGSGLGSSADGTGAAGEYGGLFGGGGKMDESGDGSADFRKGARDLASADGQNCDNQECLHAPGTNIFRIMSIRYSRKAKQGAFAAVTGGATQVMK